jgi:hypothetical protein
MMRRAAVRDLERNGQRKGVRESTIKGGEEEGKGQGTFTHILKLATGEVRMLSSFMFGPRRE